MTVLTLRALNRTLLTRQLLTRRANLSALQVVEHLVAMQSQEPNWPYIGLWARMEDFEHGELTALLEGREAVRGTLIRSTQHLLSSADYRWLRPTIQPVLDGNLRSAYFADGIAGLSRHEVVEAGTGILAGGDALTRARLGALLAEVFPGRSGAVLGGVVQRGTPLVHPPPNGVWGRWGNRHATPMMLADLWLGGPMDQSDVDTMIQRYLTAFGPATVRDIQAWSGLTRLREVVDRLRGELRIVHDEEGRELVDVPDAPLADGDSDVPVRLIPAYDNLLLAHADRRRVIPDEHRGPVFPGRAVVRPTLLVDGFVAGVWEVKGTTLAISPFGRLTKPVRAQVLDEAERLLEFLDGDPAAWSIRLG